MDGNAAELRLLESRRAALVAGAAEALGHGEAGLQLLVDSVNEGLATVDGGGRITWANRSLCEMTGYRLDEILGHHAAEFLDESNRSVFEQQFGNRRSGARDRYEIEWIRKDGSRLSSIVSPQPLFGREDAFAGSVCVVSDISAVREAERSARLSEARIQTIFSSAAVGFAVVDASGCLVQVNKHLADLCGYSADELLGRPYLDLVPPEERPEVRAKLELFFRGELNLLRAERRYLRRDGSTFFAAFSPAPLHSEQGGIEAAIVSIVDISALKLAQQALERSERHFRQLVDYASSIILRWAVDGTIQFINPYGLRRLGYTAEQIIGRNVMGTIVPETDSAGRDLAEMIRDIPLHPERYLYNENEICDSSGRRFWVVWTNRALLDEQGKATEMLSIGTDITELRNARESLARQRDELTELNEFIRRVFGRYVSDAVVHSLLESPGGLRVGGTSRTVSILVADIRGFSSLCEELTPEQVVGLLNTFFETMTTVIEQHDGTIDELIGDGILVIFGAPAETADHAQRAVACALAMQLAIDDVNARNRARGLPAIEMGVGIDTGVVVAGNIGSTKRAKYGVVGNHVNLASRIESYTVGGQILISRDTKRAAGAKLRVGRRLCVEPKGARQPIQLYEVVAFGDLALAEPERSPAMAEVDLAASFLVLEDKFVSGTPHTARVVRLSVAEAELLCDEPPPLLSNIKLQLGEKNGRGHADNVYAKVTECAEAGRIHLHFTAMPPAARRSIERAVAAPAKRNAQLAYTAGD